MKTLDLASIIDQIYEAAIIPSTWPHVLEHISDHIGGDGALMFGAGAPYQHTVCSPSLEETFDLFVSEGWSKRDPSLPRAVQMDHAGFIADHDLLTSQEMDDDDVYTFYRRRNIGFRAGSVIQIPTGESIAVAFMRDQTKGRVPPAIVTLLDGLRPHLARASMNAMRLGFELARAQAEALQMVGLPAAVLRGQGRVFAANSFFEALMPSLFLDRTDRLHVVDPAADGLLGTAFASMRDANDGCVRSIAIGARDERVPMVIHVLPIRGAAHDLFTQAKALLVVTPVNRGVVPSAHVLQGLFDLTPAEAHVARAVASAQSLEDLASARGVSRETVRSQLKNVLAKTGLSRQQELVSLLAGYSPFR